MQKTKHHDSRALGGVAFTCYCKQTGHWHCRIPQKGCAVQRQEGAAVSCLSSVHLHCRGWVQQGLVGAGQAELVRAAELILCYVAPKQIFEQVDSILGQWQALDNISMSLPALLPMKN